MILHIVDDEKFIDKAVYNFTKIQPKNHEFIAITNKEFEYIKNDFVKRRSKLIFIKPSFLLSLFQYEAIVFHKLTISRAIIAILISQYVKIVWNGFGADYYDLISEKENLFQSETLKIYLSLSKKTNVINRLKNWISIYLKKIVLKRIAYFSPVLKSEFVLIKNAIPGFKAEFIDWTYGVITDAFDQISRLKVDKHSSNQVLVGNSATFENNHIDIFRLINKVNDKINIIVPLSYGDTEYKNEIKQVGKNLFGNRFIVQEEFLSFPKYLKLINSCDHIIMNHLRQQALGNIYIAILLGKSLYIQEKNPIYELLLEQNIKFYSVNDLVQNGFMNLEIDEKKKNKEIIYGLNNQNMITNKTKRMIEIITN